jgi:hypothetical protein
MALPMEPHVLERLDPPGGPFDPPRGAFDPVVTPFAAASPEALGPSLKERLVGLLPLLCLIHCVGTAVLASLMPAAALWMENEWLEGGLSALSALLIGFLVVYRRGLSWLGVLFASVVALGVAGWVGHYAWLRHGALVGMVAVQLLWLHQRRQSSRQAVAAAGPGVAAAGQADCACTSHGGHGHSHRHGHRHRH